MKKIFFVTYGGGHINIVKLIARELIENHNVSIKILALTTAYEAARKEFSEDIVKKISDYKFLFEKDIEIIEKKGLEFLCENYSVGGPVTEEETKNYIGLSFLDLISKYGEEKANKLYKNKKRQAFLPTTIIKEILKSENVDIVVSTTSPRFEQASLIAGKELNIKTLQVLDLFSDVFPLPEADHIVVMNDYVKKGLENKGLKNKTYHVLGQPAIEETVLKVLKTNKKELAKEKKIDLTKKTLLFATQKLSRVDENYKISESIPYEVVYDELFEILNRIHKIFNINVFIRIHPNENYKDYSKYFDKYDFLKYTNPILSLEESIALSDFVLVKTSTVAIESKASGKTVFTYKHDSEKFYSVPVFTKEPFIFSPNLSELEKSIVAYLKNESDNLKDDFLVFNSKKEIANLLMNL